MINNLRMKIWHGNIYILIMSLWFVGLSPLTILPVEAISSKSFNATMGSLCGKLVFLTEAKTGASRLGLRPCGGDEKPYVFEQNPADLFNVYQFKDVEVESGAVFDSVEHGKLTKYITGWVDYYQIASCADCNKGKPVVPTLTITLTSEMIATETEPPVIFETATSTLQPPNISLAIVNFQAEPGNPVLNQRFVLHVIIENQGDPLDEIEWNYSGKVSLKDANGSELETYSFAKDRDSYMKQAEENGQIIPNKWVISIPISINHEVDNGRLSITLQSDIYRISPTMVEALVTIKPAGSDLRSCAILVAEKSGVVFSEDATLKTAWDGERATLAAASCSAEDVGCFADQLAQGLVRTFMILNPDIQQNAWTNYAPQMDKLLAGLAAIFEVNTLQVCRQPDRWLWRIVEELNHQGLAVNILHIPASAVMKIGNAAGEISGVSTGGELVNQIPETQVIQWNRQIFILYAPQEVLVTTQGMANGVFTLQGILGKGTERVSMAFENVPITDGALAVVNTADVSGDMQVDTDNDGQTDTAVPMSRAEVISPATIVPQAQPTATATPVSKIPFNLPCMSALMVGLPLAGIFILRKKQLAI